MTFNTDNSDGSDHEHTDMGGIGLDEVQNGFYTVVLGFLLFLALTAWALFYILT